MSQPVGYQVGPFDSAHLYMQWGGKLPGGEQWSCGLRFYGTGSATAAATAGLVGVGAAAVEYHQRAGTHIQGAAKLSFVKLNAVGTDGRYALQTTNEATFADVAGGDAGEFVSTPNQVALAVSLTTGFSRGPAHRGRFYLPLPRLAIGSDGLITAAAAAEVGVSTDTFLANLNSAISGWKVGVFSRKAGSAGHREVTGNEVGRVLDTQRRRRRSLVEDYR